MKINVKVKPNSGIQKVEQLSGNEYKVFLKSVPENNKANKELIRILSKYFKEEVKIKSGFTSRKKVVEVSPPPE